MESDRSASTLAWTALQRNPSALSLSRSRCFFLTLAMPLSSTYNLFYQIRTLVPSNWEFLRVLSGTNSPHICFPLACAYRLDAFGFPRPANVIFGCSGAWRAWVIDATTMSPYDRYQS
ncbi:hypothetical protein BJ912DRAFT_1060369 [Pholiota molesta]|nr:hypothetical protein BJ912DRAFT_1060369 [Pholiota molesta]